MKCCVVNSSVSNAAKSLQLLLFTHCMIIEMLKLGPPGCERNDGLREKRWVARASAEVADSHHLRLSTYYIGIPIRLSLEAQC